MFVLLTTSVLGHITLRSRAMQRSGDWGFFPALIIYLVIALVFMGLFWELQNSYPDMVTTNKIAAIITIAVLAGFLEWVRYRKIVR